MILLLLLFLHYLWAKGGLTSVVENIEAGGRYQVDYLPDTAPAAWSDVPHPNSKYVIRHITSCPIEGYYFKRELTPNSLGPPDCYLCFCQGDDTAVCWLRENRRCDVEGFHYHNVGKRDARRRRSPMSLGELFFKDAAKEVFNKQTPEVCKPFESSFSEGCPPDDWCIGCTVCDCNANGRWDCHVLSFCDDNKGKKQMIKRRKPKSKVIKSNQKTIIRSTNKKVSKTQEKYKPPKINNKITKRAPAPSIAPSRNKNTIKKGNKSPKPVFKKGVQARKTTENKAKKVTNRPATDQMTQEVVKRVVTVMQNLLRKQVTATVPEIIKIVQKKSMEMNNMYNKNQQNKIKSAVKRKVPTGNRKQYNRPVAVSKAPTKNNKVNNYNYPSTANKSPRNSKRSTIMNKKANTKLMDTYRFKRNAFLDNETTAEMAHSVQLENFTTTSWMGEELTENVTSNNTAADEDYNYTLNSVTQISYNVTDIYNNLTDSTVDIKNRTSINGPQSLNYSDTVLHLPVTESLLVNTKVRTQIHNKTKRIHVLLDKIASANDLKYMKWSQIKLYKQKEKELRSQSNNTISSPSSDIEKNLKNYSNIPSLATESKVKIHKFQLNVERKLDNVPKRLNIPRVVNTKACNAKHEDNFYSGNSTHGLISKKIGSLQNVLKKMLAEFQKNNTTVAKTRGKLNVVKYLKKFFKKLFYKNNKNSKITEIMANKRTIETLCASFGPCVINKRNKVLLRRKLKELNNETDLMMESINIIKGLLRLLDFSNIDKSTNNFDEWNEKSNITDDIKKLSRILKKEYSNTKYAMKLSETQLTQIDYIKNNTQVFIQSVVRFVNILNDVINILTAKNNKVHAQHKSTSIINNRNKFRSQDPLQKLKQLLVKYNIVQNTFMSKMYEIINKFQQNISSGGTKEYESDSKGNEASNLEANRFSNNILRNVRKLKTIAETLRSGGRKKRQLNRNDDAMEYLLMIMEYLMKKKQSVHVAPVNDGIDLLIEAIQNAPDIKPITNHVHIHIPLKKVRAGETSSNDMSDDDVSNPYIISEEHNFTSKADVIKSKHTDRPFDDEKSYDPSKFVKKVENEGDSPSFLGINNKTVDKNQTLNNYYTEEKNTSVPIEFKSEDNDEITVSNHVDQEHSNTDTEAVLDESGKKRKFEVFVAEYEDDSEEVVNATTNASELLIEYSPPTTSLPSTEDTLLFKYSDTKIRNFNEGFITNGSVKFITKSTLKWIDTEDEEDKPVLVKYSRETVKNPVTEALTQRVTPKEQSKKIPEDTSNFSKELDDEDKKKLSKVNVDEVMIKKQMNLLNSLDYGTEGTIVDDSDSKDVRYPNDSYDL